MQGSWAAAVAKSTLKNIREDARGAFLVPHSTAPVRLAAGPAFPPWTLGLLLQHIFIYLKRDVMFPLLLPFLRLNDAIFSFVACFLDIWQSLLLPLDTYLIEDVVLWLRLYQCCTSWDNHAAGPTGKEGSRE